MPTSPEGVRACEGIPRESWSTRVVILTNEAGEDVARAICRSVDASVVVDTNGRSIKVIFIKMRQNHNFETWRIEGECFQESLFTPLNSTSSHSHLRQR